MFESLSIEQLLILQRALLEAKFLAEPRDPALQGSPILAELSFGVVQAIKDHYARVGDRGRVQQWIDWSQWHRRTIEKDLVRDHLRSLEKWNQMSEEVRMAYVRSLVAPFVITPEELGELIGSVSE
ncbi:MAG TPA: hypothetical protein VFZ97_00855 [Acidimicrobiales bacterium]